MHLIADMLTIARGVMVVFILILSILNPDVSLPWITILTILCWVTDVLDGKYARKAIRPTRLGAFDSITDQGLAISLVVLLILTDMIPFLPSVIIIILAAIGKIFFHFDAPQKFLKGVIYALLIYVVWWKLSVFWGLAMVLSLIFLVFLNPQRTKQLVSGFLKEFSVRFQKHDPEEYEQISKK